MELVPTEITKCKYLFLDRDGVINVRIIGGYVTCKEEFAFIDGVLDAMSILAKHFDYIFLITNQQGIGKGLMTEDALAEIHRYMTDEIESHGGKMTKIYYCPYLASEHHPDRKPDIGMGLKAKHDFPEIDFKESVMVGDGITDIVFGKRLEMNTVYIGSDEDDFGADYCCSNLKEFADLFNH